MHDILPGSSIPEVYDDAWDCWQVFEKWTREIETGILEGFKKAVGIQPGTTGVMLLNPLAVLRNDLVTIPWDAAQR